MNPLNSQPLYLSRTIIMLGHVPSKDPMIFFALFLPSIRNQIPKNSFFYFNHLPAEERRNYQYQVDVYGGEAILAPNGQLLKVPSNEQLKEMYPKNRYNPITFVREKVQVFKNSVKNYVVDDLFKPVNDLKDNISNF